MAVSLDARVGGSANNEEELAGWQSGTVRRQTTARDAQRRTFFDARGNVHGRRVVALASPRPRLVRAWRVKEQGRGLLEVALRQLVTGHQRPRSSRPAIAASISAKVFATRPTWGGSPSCRAICVNEKIPRTVRPAEADSADPPSITSAC